MKKQGDFWIINFDYKIIIYIFKKRMKNYQAALLCTFLIVLKELLHYPSKRKPIKESNRIYYFLNDIPNFDNHESKARNFIKPISLI